MTDQPTRPDLDDKAEIAKLRGLLAKENARATAAIDREETAERTALEAQEERDKLIRWHREDETALAEMRATIARLRQQRKFLITQLAKRDAATGDGDRALREFLAAPDPICGDANDGDWCELEPGHEGHHRADTAEWAQHPAAPAAVGGVSGTNQ